MRERTFVHVAGPPGSGKTTLIEAMLRAASEPIFAARCVQDDALREARETAPKSHLGECDQLACSPVAGGEALLVDALGGVPIAPDLEVLRELLRVDRSALAQKGFDLFEHEDVALDGGRVSSRTSATHRKCRRKLATGPMRAASSVSRPGAGPSPAS